MRLDHLLSKEHLTPKGVEEPAACGCWVGVLVGGDTGGVSIGNGWPAEYRRFLVGWWGKGGVGAAGGDDEHPVGS